MKNKDKPVYNKNIPNKYNIHSNSLIKVAPKKIKRKNIIHPVVATPAPIVTLPESVVETPEPEIETPEPTVDN